LKDEIETKNIQFKKWQKKQSTYLTRKTRDLGHETMITS